MTDCFPKLVTQQLSLDSLFILHVVACKYDT